MGTDFRAFKYSVTEKSFGIGTGKTFNENQKNVQQKISIFQLEKKKKRFLTDFSLCFACWLTICVSINLGKTFKCETESVVRTGKAYVSQYGWDQLIRIIFCV